MNVLPCLQRVSDRFGDLALDTEDVGELAIKGIGPQMRIAGHLDELDGDAHLIGGLKPVGAWAGCQLLIARGEQSGSLTQIAATESVSCRPKLTCLAHEISTVSVPALDEPLVWVPLGVWTSASAWK